MGRRHDRDRSRNAPSSFEFERTLAAAEEEESDSGGARCSCGSGELLLEAYVRVVDGRPQSEFVEVETLTCPQCGREYEAVQMEDGRIECGEYLGQMALED